METKHYLINATFATKTGIPASFVAIKLKETEKAIFVHGHGKMDPKGSCVRCGRPLTHPGSIIIGIGPICLGDWGRRDVVLDNVTEEQKKDLQAFIQEQKIHQWIPKSIIKRNEVVDEIIDYVLVDDPKPTGKKEEPIMKKARVWKGKIAIQFKYDAELIDKIKTLDGRTYVPKGKYWSSPILKETVRKLIEWEFELDEELKGLIKTWSKESAKTETKEARLTGFKKELYPFQKEGLDFIEKKNGRALVGDEMGLGKTIQALAYLQLHPKKRPAVIVCPASLKLNWKKEIEEGLSTNDHIAILSGKTPYKVDESILIINYDILDAWGKYLRAINVSVMVTDECHYFKTPTSIRTKAVMKLGKVTPHIIALSGTPIENRPIEIFNAIKLIDPYLVSNRFAFGKKYCGATHNGFGWDFSGASNTAELHTMLTESIMIRRLKKDVLKDLPDKVRSFVPIALNNREEYNTVENDFIEYIKATKGEAAAAKVSVAETLVQIEYLKQAAVKGKMDSVINWVKNFLDTGAKLVLFATHKTAIDRLMEEFKDEAVKIDGSVSTANRQKAVEGFQNDHKIRLFVGNIEAAGVGLTLTAASNVAFIELPWTPGKLVQAEDRCHRIGQKYTVNIWYLLAEQTIEDDIAALLDSKRKVLDAVIDGKETEDVSLIGELMSKYRNK